MRTADPKEKLVTIPSLKTGKRTGLVSRQFPLEKVELIRVIEEADLGCTGDGVSGAAIVEHCSSEASGLRTRPTAVCNRGLRIRAGVSSRRKNRAEDSPVRIANQSRRVLTPVCYAGLSLRRMRSSRRCSEIYAHTRANDG